MGPLQRGAPLGRPAQSHTSFDDGSYYKEITPEHYVEGPYMMKHQGKYYLMWSEGGWTGPDYSVAYAISDSPTGPLPPYRQDSATGFARGHWSRTSFRAARG